MKQAARYLKQARSFARFTMHLVHCFGVGPGLWMAASALHGAVFHHELTFMLKGRRIRLRTGTPESYLFDEKFLKGQYDFSVFEQSKMVQGAYEKARNSVQPPIILDCGANVGLSTLWFSMNFPGLPIYTSRPMH